MGKTVILEPDSEPRVARVTFDRPDVLNAVNDEVLDDLEAVVGRLEADGETAVVVLTGRGDRAFIAGGDIAHMARLAPSELLARNPGNSSSTSACSAIETTRQFASARCCDPASNSSAVLVETDMLSA